VEARAEKALGLVLAFLAEADGNGEMERHCKAVLGVLKGGTEDAGGADGDRLADSLRERLKDCL